MYGGGGGGVQRGGGVYRGGGQGGGGQADTQRNHPLVSSHFLFLFIFYLSFYLCSRSQFVKRQ